MSSCALDIEKSAREEIEELFKDVCSQRKKYNEYQIIHDVIFECAKESCKFNMEFQSKILDILTTNNVQACTGLANNCTLLGLNFDLTDLTYEENENLKEAAQMKLTEKRRGIFKELCELGIAVEANDDHFNVNVSTLNLNVQEKVLVDSKRQLNEKQELYLRLLQELRDILEKIINLKVKTLAETTNDKIKDYQVQADLFSVKTKILNVKLKARVFSETSLSLNAYKELFKDIFQQQKDCKEEIEKLRELKEKYRQVSCKQYDDILRSYINYKSNIEKRKRLYNHIHKK